jgi:hypothetical protein
MKRINPADTVALYERVHLEPIQGTFWSTPFMGPVCGCIAQALICDAGSEDQLDNGMNTLEMAHLAARLGFTYNYLQGVIMGFDGTPPKKNCHALTVAEFHEYHCGYSDGKAAYHSLLAAGKFVHKFTE